MVRYVASISGILRNWQRGHSERAEREPITGFWGWSSPQRSPGVWSGDQKGLHPLKLKH